MRRQGVSCYRLYDADLPDYNLAIDVYEGRLHVQEYAPPAEIPPAAAAARLEEALAVVTEVLDKSRDGIVVKERRRQRGAAQYQRHASGGAFFPVTEDGLTYVVNLTDYLDTGLFLDQRLTRRLIRQEAGGRRFLNLFAYTGAATVSAVAGGASASTTVDLSATYLDWARRNLQANGIEEGTAHRLIRADALEWVGIDDGQYDLILLDPPTFSNSKRMDRASFDVQRDHADLIRARGQAPARARRRPPLLQQPPQLPPRARGLAGPRAQGPLARHVAARLRPARRLPPRLAGHRHA